MQTTDIEREIRTFLVETFLFGRDEELRDDSPLMDKVIDSHGVVELVVFLQERFAIRVEDEEVTNEGATRITWQIEAVGDSCHLTLTHDEMREGASNQIYGGWPMILSGLKTWLETGESLTTPGSLMYNG